MKRVFQAVILFTGLALIHVLVLACYPNYKYLSHVFSDYHQRQWSTKLIKDCKTVLLGNSIVYLLADSLLDENVYKFGCAGAQISTLTLRINTLNSCAGKSLIILIGINDVMSRKSLSRMMRDYSELLEIVNRQNWRKVSIIGVLPINIESGYFTNNLLAKRRIRLLNSYLSDKAIVNSNLEYIDPVGFTNKSLGLLKSELTRDGVHLNDKGQQELLKIIQDIHVKNSAE